MPSIIIIVPCFNEGSRLQVNRFISFSKEHTDIQFLFVNDGSDDNTGDLLLMLQQSAPGINFITLEKNEGKGEAVRQGIIAALSQSTDYIGYLDADLSTSLEEFYRIFEEGKKNALDIVLGSRIQKIDTVIERSYVRHIIGRILATIIDQKFKLGVYDTQCGAKIYKSFYLERVVSKPFYSKWFFDVELLVRIRKNYQRYKVEEIPLRSWRNVGNSKLGVLSFPEVLEDLSLLLTKY